MQELKTQLNMNKYFFYNNLKVNVIINKRLKHSYIQIVNSQEITIKTLKNSKQFILHLIQTKYIWILKHIQRLKSKISHEQHIDEILLFNKIININKYDNKQFQTRLLKLQTLNKQKRVKLYDDIYRFESRQYIVDRVAYFSQIMNLIPSKILFRKMKRRWGSCKSNKEITFNIYLLRLPKELIDYVIVHEIAHIKHMNHSKKFYIFLKLYLKNSDDLKQKITHFIITPLQ